MTPANLPAVPDEKDVQRYVGLLQSIDWKTGLTALAILVIGLLLVRLIIHFVEKLLKKSSIPASVHSIIRTLLRIVLDLMVVLTAAARIGIPVTSFITLLGLAGLALSLALQGIMENFAGGLLILTSKPFAVGDVIETDTLVGSVRDIRIMSTRLESFDGKNIYIPNSNLYKARIINYSQLGRRRVELTVSASYNNPPDQVRRAVMSVVEGTKGVLADPAPAFMTASYGDSAIQYTLWVWCNGSDFLSVRNGISEGLYAAFAEHGVEMTYPHLNVHMK